MKESQEKVLIIIPVYRDYFDDFEQKSLGSVGKHLKEFQIAFVAPKSLDISFLNSYELGFEHSVFRFDDAFFSDIEGYNQLMLSHGFYQTFLDYEYILICQTDAYIFKNDLNYWLNKGFDYVGAPWLDSKNRFFSHQWRSFFNKLKKYFGFKEKRYTHINKVGNGGFSLRKTSTFFEIATKEQAQIKKFIENKEKENYHIEDVFWSLYAPQYHTVNIADYKTALFFCVDRKPEVAFELLKNQYPFACHGFNKKGVSEFWSKHII